MFGTCLGQSPCPLKLLFPTSCPKRAAARSSAVCSKRRNWAATSAISPHSKSSECWESPQPVRDHPPDSTRAGCGKHQPWRPLRDNRRNEFSFPSRFGGFLFLL